VQLLQAALHVQGKNTPDNPEVDGGDVDGSHEDVPQDMPWYDKELTPEQLALVPKDLKPVTEEHLGSLALLVANATESSEISPSYDGAYCGYSKRFDVAAAMKAKLSVEQCYLHSCTWMKVSSTCGPYFYTDGTGNCKCCDYGSTYYYSTANPPNDLYACR